MHDFRYLRSQCYLVQSQNHRELYALITPKAIENKFSYSYQCLKCIQRLDSSAMPRPKFGNSPLRFLVFLLEINWNLCDIIFSLVQIQDTQICTKTNKKCLWNSNAPNVQNWKELYTCINCLINSSEQKISSSVHCWVTYLNWKFIESSTSLDLSLHQFLCITMSGFTLDFFLPQNQALYSIRCTEYTSLMSVRQKGSR
jgi:hypothetical protein